MSANLKYVPVVATPGAGRIHSIYRSTINFTLKGKLFSLQSGLAACSPVSFVATQDVLPRCRLGENVAWDGHTLKIGGLSFAADQAEHFSGILPIGRFCPLPERTILPVPTSFFGGSAASHTEAQEIMLCLSKTIKTGNWTDAAEVASEMLGLGCGLTPSGDDWLTGLLALLHFTALQADSAVFLRALCAQLSARLHETNDVSARFLELACAGRFSAPICALFSAWHNGDTSGLARAVSQVLRLGHTSGADTLAGIRFLYDHLKMR